MRFKITKSKAADASNSTAIDKFANAVVGDFGLMGDIHALISASLVNQRRNTGKHMLRIGDHLLNHP